jgi:hypothetical protein
MSANHNAIRGERLSSRVHPKIRRTAVLGSNAWLPESRVFGNYTFQLLRTGRSAYRNRLSVEPQRLVLENALLFTETVLSWLDIGCMIRPINYAQSGRTMEDSQRPEPRRRRSAPIRMPGFLFDEELGLGDMVKRATYALGITPCSTCEQRAAALNRLVVFSGKKGPSFSGDGQ